MDINDVTRIKLSDYKEEMFFFIKAESLNHSGFFDNVEDLIVFCKENNLMFPNAVIGCKKVYPKITLKDIATILNKQITGEELCNSTAIDYCDVDYNVVKCNFNPSLANYLENVCELMNEHMSSDKGEYWYEIDETTIINLV